MILRIDNCTLELEDELTWPEVMENIYPALIGAGYIISYADFADKCEELAWSFGKLAKEGVEDDK